MKRQTPRAAPGRIHRAPQITQTFASTAEQPSDAQLRHDLLALIDSGRLRDSALFQAGKVLTRLGTPARVVLVGNADRVKAALVGVLLGEAFDGPPRTTAILITAQTATPQQSAFASRGNAASKPRPIEHLTHVSPTLAALSLLLVPAASNRAARREDLAWSAERSDICVWDCLGFDSTEAALWSEAPTALRANAFLAAPQIGAVPPGFLARFDPQAELTKLAAAVQDRALLARQTRRDQAALFLRRYSAAGAQQKAGLAVRNWQTAPGSAKTD